MKSTLVLTTINEPTLLYGYADNFDRYDRRAEVSIIVIGDRKTPAGAAKVLSDLKARGYDARYVDIPQQLEWLKRFPGLAEAIPFDTDNRRNIGHLMAAENGADVIVALDDDNFVTEGDYIAGHTAVVGSSPALDTVSSSTGWYNICEMLETKPQRTIYARGFPYSKRWIKTDLKIEKQSARIAANGGLWLVSPDVDAVTRLNETIETTKLLKDRIALAPGTYSPINTQNSAFHRDALPCFYYVLMGAKVDGLAIDRFGDIFSGYLAKAVMDTMGDRMSFGLPLATHNRNQHNLLKDLRQELLGLMLTDTYVEILRGLKLPNTSYLACYESLTDQFEAATQERKDFSTDLKTYFRDIAKAQRAWNAACRQLGY